MAVSHHHAMHTRAKIKHHVYGRNFEPTFHFRGFHNWFLHSYASPFRLPDPVRMTVPTRPVVVGAAPSRYRHLPARAAPAPSGRRDGLTRKDSHLPTDKLRLVAHPVVGPDLPPGRLGEGGRRAQHVDAVYAAADRPCPSSTPTGSNPLPCSWPVFGITWSPADARAAADRARDPRPPTG